MINKVKSSFFKNVLTLMTGSTLAQLIPILSMPIITRIYSPYELGLLTLFLSFLMIISSFVTAKFDSVILLVKNNINVVNTAALIILVGAVFSFSIFIGLLFFNKQVVNLFELKELSSYIYFLPLMAFLFALYQALYFMNLKKKQFKVIRNIMVYRAFTNASSQILLGLSGFSILGLILSQLLGSLSGLYNSATNLLSYKKFLIYINFKRIWILMVKYKDFPKFSLPSSVLNVTAYEIVSIMISSTFSVAILGLFMIGKKAIGAPSKLISNSIKNVYMEKISYNKNNNIPSHRLFIKLLLRLSAMALLLCGSMFFIIEDLFRIVFGSKWEEAGTIAKYLLPYYGLNFVATPLATVLIIYEKQKINFLWQLGLLCVTIFVFIFEFIFKWDLYQFLTIYSIVISIHLSILIYISYLVSKGK